ncbi:MAG: phenylacetate--CoA ligase, partial [Rhodobacteraceae bacterium]|nr:phenylacetate--CoA ligase [Paracoccaceae bacterium]
MSEFYDDLETRDRKAREGAQFAELPFQIANAKNNAPYYRDLLKDVSPEDITSRSALAALPLTRKSQLIDLQRNSPPFGGLATVAAGDLVRIYQSPGPIYDLEPLGRDTWRTARALYAAGFRDGDVIHNTFSYHFTPPGDDRTGRPRPRLHRVSGRARQHRSAGAGDPRHPADVLRRHPIVPEDPARQGAGVGVRHLQPDPRQPRGGSAAAQRPRRTQGGRHRRHAVVRH